MSFCRELSALRKDLLKKTPAKNLLKMTMKQWPTLTFFCQFPKAFNKTPVQQGFLWEIFLPASRIKRINCSLHVSQLFSSIPFFPRAQSKNPRRLFEHERRRHGRIRNECLQEIETTIIASKSQFLRGGNPDFNLRKTRKSTKNYLKSWVIYLILWYQKWSLYQET